MAKRKVIGVPMDVSRGLATHYSPEATAGNFLVESQNMDWYRTFLGLGKMPGTIGLAPSPSYPSANVPCGVYAYGAFTEMGQYVRHQVVDYNGALYRVLNGSLSSAIALPTGSTLPASGTIARTAQFDNRLFATYPDADGLNTGMISWDGESMRDVGVLAPGDKVTALNTTTSNTGWTAEADTTLNAVADYSVLGTSSISVSKTGTSGTTCSVTLTGVAHNISTPPAGEGQVYIDVYLPSSVHVKLAEQQAIEIMWGEASFTAYSAKYFDKGELQIGWNRLTLVVAAGGPDFLFNGGATNSDVNAWRFRARFAASATTTSLPILWSYLHYADEQSPAIREARIQEGFDDLASWAAGNADTTRVMTTTLTQDGNAVEMRKTGTASANCFLDNTDTFNWGTASHVYVYLYLSASAYDALATGAGLAGQIAYGTGGFVNYNAKSLSKSALGLGWNLIDVNLASPDATGGAGATLTNVNRLRVQLNTVAAGNTFAGAVWDCVHTQSTGTKIFNGNITDTPSYVMTYVNSRGVESNFGEYDTGSVVLTSGAIAVIDIPVSSQDDIVERRFYRDSNGDRVFRYVKSLYDNQQTQFIDNTASSGLSSITPPQFGSTNFDNGVPGKFYALEMFANRLFGVDAKQRNVLRYSDVNSPDTWRLVDQLTLDEPITAIKTHAVGLLVYVSDGSYLLMNDGLSAPFALVRVSNSVGCNNWRSVVEIKGSHFVWHEKKAYLIQNPQDPWYISGPVQDGFDNYEIALSVSDTDDDENLQGMVVLDYARTRILFLGLTEAGARQLYFWQFGTRDEKDLADNVDPMDIRNGVWGTIGTDVYPVQTGLPVMLPAEPDPVTFTLDGDVTEIWFQDTTGVYVLNRDGALNNVKGFGGSAVTSGVDAAFTMASVPLGRSHDGRGMVRYLAIDAYATAASTWDVTIDLLTGSDGAIVETLTRTISLAAGKSSPVISLGAERRASWARVRLTNDNVGEDGVFLNKPRLYFIPRTSGHGVRSGV